jgi:hypothetical protein|tara:strand:+ start:485 stop:682 length:198 start_codon:yes stop_codon:yes gene_type:complete
MSSDTYVTMRRGRNGESITCLIVMCEHGNAVLIARGRLRSYTTHLTGCPDMAQRVAAVSAAGGVA